MLKKIITKRSDRVRSSFDFITVLAIVIFLIFAGLIIFKISPSMDEYLPYHQLACLVNGTQNIFRESCSEYNLILFGKSLPLRSFSYVGFSNSILYLPFYLLWKSYLSARFLKLIILILTAIFAIRITKVDWKIGLLIVGCFFPFAVQMLVDTGPIAFQCLTMVFVIWLFSRSNYSLRDGVLAGIVTLFAVEQKMFFAPFLLAVFAYCFIAYDGRRNFAKLINFFAPVAIIVSLGSLLILSAQNSRGISYMAEIGSKFSRIPVTDFSSQAQHLADFKPFISSFYNFAERVINTAVVRDFNTSLFYLVILAVGFVAFRSISVNENRQEIREFAAGIFALALSIWLMGLSQDSSRAHHLAIIIPFFLLALLSAYRVIATKNLNLASALVLLFLVPNFLILARTVNLTPYPQDDWSRLELIEYTQQLPGEKNAFVISDWGVYYLLSLYANKNSPVYFEDLTSGVLDQPIKNLIENNYSIYLVSRQKPSNGFYNFTEMKYNDKSNNWHLYKINENNQ